MFLGLAVHAVKKHGLQPGGNRTALTAADAAVVKLANRCHLRRGTGEKSFVSTINLVTRDPFLDHRDSDLSREFYDGGTGNPLQARSHVWRIELATLDDEYVFTRAFCHVPIHVQ